MTIYIAGKVTGLSFIEVTQKFGMAQQEVEAAGFTAINPLAVVNDWHTPWPQAMRLCITALMTADKLYALPCCANSKGATLELQLAKKLGIEIVRNIKDAASWIN